MPDCSWLNDRAGGNLIYPGLFEEHHQDYTGDGIEQT